MSEKLEWQLIAKDEASATFEKVKKAQDQLAKSTESVSTKNKESSNSWQSVAKGVFAGGIAIQGAQKAFEFLKGAITSSIAEAQDFEKNQAQLNAVLQSTKGAAGVTKDELNQMAQELSNLTAIDDDVINSMQAMQLTFTNITKPVFKEVSMAALDMATAMNSGVTPSAEQLKSQMIQLGKAINNPKDGLTALTRVGVSFNDQQKKTIEKLVESGNTMEAQKLILEELNKEFGGSAVAAANTYQGQLNRLNNAMGDVKKTIGQALLPTLTLFIGGVADNTGKLQVNQEQLKNWQLRIYQAGVIIKGVALTIGGFIKTIWDMTVLLGKASAVQIAAWADAGKAVLNFGQTAKSVFEAMKKALTGDFSGALDSLKTDFKETFATTKFAMEDFMNQAKKVGNDIGGALDPMDRALKEVVNPVAFNSLMAKMDETEKKTAEMASGVGSLIGNTATETKEGAEKMKEAVSGLKDKYSEVMGTGGKIGESLAKLEEDHTKAIDGINSKLKELKTQLQDTEAEYKKTVGELNKTEAERVIEQQDKIKQLKADNAPAEQIAKEENALREYMTKRAGLDAELTEARRRADLTDFQRFIEDLNAKRKATESDHQLKLQQLNTEIAQQQEQANQENIIYEGKKKQYQQVQSVFQVFHDKYLTNLDNMKSATKKSVEEMNTKLKEMVNILNQIESAKNKAGLLANANNNSDLIATGNQSGQKAETTNNKNNNVTITNNITISGGNKQDAQDLINQMLRQLQLAGVASQ